MNDTNQGWKQVDEWYLNKYDNAQVDPDIQILTEDNYEDENKELREYYCAVCHGKLDFIKNMDMWYCEACVQYYDTKIQDVPIKNINDSKDVCRAGTLSLVRRWRYLSPVCGRC